MDIEVGEYVRTDEGIDKFLYKSKYDNGANKYVFEKISMSNPEYYILKHSKDIIDLIEVGDYVNGKKVDEVRNNYYIFCNNYENEYKENDIKSIVTKEQFKNIEYKVEE